jgi:hypothetical protein
MIKRKRVEPPRTVASVVVRMAAVTMLACATWLLAASSASAIVVHVKGRALSYQPLPRTSLVQALPVASERKPVLKYFGGPIMTSNTNFALYWDPAGAPAYQPGYETGINQFFTDLAHDSGGVQNTDSVLVQYTNSAHEAARYDSVFGGARVDTHAYPRNGCEAAPICLTDEQIQAEITRYVEAEKLPTGLADEYFLLTPPGVESCFEPEGLSCSAGAENAEYCAYHSAISLAAAKVIIYANDPDEPACDTGDHPNGAGDIALGGGLVHEHSESVTDPELNAWKAKNGEEVGDLCRTFEPESEFGEPIGLAADGAKYNQVINGHYYWYQQEWSNEAEGCAQRAGSVPAVTKLVPRVGPETGGTPVTVTGKGFVGTVTVSFGGVAATEVEVKSSTSLLATSPPGSKGKVNVTVTTSRGPSPATTKDRFKYKA